MLDVNWNPSPRDLRQFAAIWLPAFAALAGAALVYRSGSWNSAGVMWIVAAAIAVAGLLRPRAIRPLFVGLTVVSYPIGWVVSHAVLAVVYFGLFTVAGFIMRLFRYDPLERRADAGAGSYWRKRSDGKEAAEYFRQF